MKKYTFLFLFLILNYSGFAIEIPSGGVDILKETLGNHGLIGDNLGSLTVVDVAHTEFNKAISVIVNTKPDNHYNIQLSLSPQNDVTVGDVCLVSFWARCTESQSEAGEGMVTAVIEKKETWEKAVDHAFMPGLEWRHFVFAFKSELSIPTNQMSASFFVGHRLQTVQFANIQFLNYHTDKNLTDMPVMEVYYGGIEDDAPWRLEAQSRIEKYRKGNVTVQVLDNGVIVNDASVTISMQQHLFGFGSAIAGDEYVQNATYRKTFHKYFNEAVFENDLKWPQWIGSSDHSYISKVMDSLDSHGTSIRGHCAVWPGWGNLPDYLQSLKSNPGKMRWEVNNHIRTVGSFTKGRVVDWDVMNEPYTNHDLQDIFGDDIMADWFKEMKWTDPEVRCFINDYGILSNGGYNEVHQDHYFNTIQFIENQGAKIDGIGFQGHFADGVTSIPRLIEVVDRFAVLGKPIKVTEFDINSDNMELKTNYTRDFLISMFSHPYVTSILSWGFWSNRHWMPQAAYFNEDWSIRPNGMEYEKLVLGEWWTPDAQTMTNALGNASFGSCFLGNYELIVESGGHQIKLMVSIPFNDNDTVTVDISTNEVEVKGTNHTDTPEFTIGVLEPRITDIISEENQGAHKLRIYPNPASDFIKVDMGEGLSANRKVTILNSLGERCAEITTNEVQFELNTIGLQPGLYHLCIEGDGISISKRFIKQ